MAAARVHGHCAFQRTAHGDSRLDAQMVRRSNAMVREELQQRSVDGQMLFVLAS